MDNTEPKPLATEAETLLAMQSLARARRLFMDMLEARTNVTWDPRNIPDSSILDANLKDSDLFAGRTRESMNDKLKFALIRVRQRESQCGAPPCDGKEYVEWQPQPGHDNTLAISKLVGAYANLMAVLAEERILSKQNGTVLYPSKPIGVLYSTITKNLLPYARLKGRKHDIDEVLRAQLGEIPKSSKEIGIATDSDAKHIESANNQITKLSEWMKSLCQNLPDDSRNAVTTLIEQLDIEAKTSYALRFDVTFEGVAQKDAHDVELDIKLNELKKKLHEVEAEGHPHGNGHSTKSSDSKKILTISKHIMRGADVIFDMAEQGEKPKTVRLVIGFQQLDVIKEALEKLLDISTTNTVSAAKNKEVGKAIDKFYASSRRSIQRLLHEGKPSNITTSYNAINKLLDSINIPDSLPEEQKKLAALKEGVELMYHIPSAAAAGPNEMGIHAEKIKLLAQRCSDIEAKQNAISL